MKTVKYCDWDTVPLMMDVVTVSYLTGVKPETVKGWLRKGVISGGKIDKEWFVDKEVFRKEVFGHDDNR